MDHEKQETTEIRETPAGPPEDDLRPMLQNRPDASPSKSTLMLASITLAAVGFIGGLFVGKSMGDDSPQVALPGIGQNGPGFINGNGNTGGLPNGGVTVGTIMSIDGDTITLEIPNGDTVAVNVDSGTTIQVTEDGSLSDLGTGDTVVVAGSQDGGSIDASSITEGSGDIPTRTG
jgi:hypothetical protein